MAKDLTRVPLQGIGVTRENKTFQPPIGKPFVFTQDELDQLVQIQEKTGEALVRKAVNEEEGKAGSTELTQAEKDAAEARAGFDLLIAAAKDAEKTLKDTPNSRPKKEALDKAVNDLRVYANEHGLEIPKKYQDTDGL